jgi:NAD(P)-dependent dehydrogenase (short-subunit alcohol dehydrogenase family)
MKVLAKELGPQSIRVNTIHPATVATDMILNEPTYRLFRPDLENPTVSDAGRYVTGTTHVVDAGGQL